MAKLCSVFSRKCGFIELDDVAKGSGRQEEGLKAFCEFIGEGELVAGVLGCQDHHIAEVYFLKRERVVIVSEG